MEGVDHYNAYREVLGDKTMLYNAVPMFMVLYITNSKLCHMRMKTNIKNWRHQVERRLSSESNYSTGWYLRKPH